AALERDLQPHRHPRSGADGDPASARLAGDRAARGGHFPPGRPGHRRRPARDPAGDRPARAAGDPGRIQRQEGPLPARGGAPAGTGQRARGRIPRRGPGRAGRLQGDHRARAGNTGRDHRRGRAPGGSRRPPAGDEGPAPRRRAGRASGRLAAAVGASAAGTGAGGRAPPGGGRTPGVRARRLRARTATGIRTGAKTRAGAPAERHPRPGSGHSARRWRPRRGIIPRPGRPLRPIPPQPRHPDPMARIIAIANQKGGVGKTTTAVNLAAALAATPKRVLLIDLDAQGNATMGSGIDKRDLHASTCDVLLEELHAEDAIVETAEGYDLLPGNTDLTVAEIELMDEDGREQRLKRALEPLRGRYDYIIVDCPPALSLLTLNALTAADSVLVPMQCEYYALEG